MPHHGATRMGGQGSRLAAIPNYRTMRQRTVMTAAGPDPGCTAGWNGLKQPRPPFGSRRSKPGYGVLCRCELLRVTLAELVHATTGIHDHVLARVERVRGRRDVDLDQRILVTVLPLRRLLAAKGRAGQELEVAGHVLEHDFAVFRMDAGFHWHSPIMRREARQYSGRSGSDASPLCARLTRRQRGLDAGLEPGLVVAHQDRGIVG